MPDFGERLVVGTTRLMGDLLAEHLTASSEAGWTYVPSLGHLAPAPEGASPRLVLLAATGMKSSEVSAMLRDQRVLDLSRDTVALLGVARGRTVEWATLRMGIRGYFYTTDSTETLSRGIETLCQGQVWITGDVVEQANRASHHATPTALPTPWNLMLSRRERQILYYISRGLSNKEIGKTLDISVHTVKTHLYRIYKKINVSSRLEASIWLTNQVRSAGVGS